MLSCLSLQIYCLIHHWFYYCHILSVFYMNNIKNKKLMKIDPAILQGENQCVICNKYSLQKECIAIQWWLQWHKTVSLWETQALGFSFRTFQHFVNRRLSHKRGENCSLWFVWCWRLFEEISRTYRYYLYFSQLHKNKSLIFQEKQSLCCMVLNRHYRFPRGLL